MDTYAMSIANFFTASRIAAAPIVLFLYYLPSYTALSERSIIVILIPLFIYMELTDFFDGYYARKYSQVSDFGKIFDPFADVVANITMLLLFMLSGYVPLIVFIIILYREMGILFLRMLARGYGITIAAKKGGKLKTVWYIFSESFSLCIETIRVFSLCEQPLLHKLIVANQLCYYLAVILSVLSFLDYVRSYHHQLYQKR